MVGGVLLCTVLPTFGLCWEVETNRTVESTWETIVSARSRYRRTFDLARTGQVILMSAPDAAEPVPAWLAVLSAAERSETQHDAQLARAKTTQAIAREDDDEHVMMEASYIEMGRDAAITMISDWRAFELLTRADKELRLDEDWREKLELIAANKELLASDRSEVEDEHLREVEKEFIAERGKRFDQMRAADRARYERMNEEALRAEFLRVFVEWRGNAVAQKELLITQAWLSARVCEAVQNEDGAWDHKACPAGHRDRIWETKQEFYAEDDTVKNIVFVALQDASEPSEEEVKN